jgi:hypothetical protein
MKPKELPKLTECQNILIRQLYYKDTALLIDNFSKRTYFCDSSLSSENHSEISIITFNILYSHNLLELRYKHGPFECWRLTTAIKKLLQPEMLKKITEEIDIKEKLKLC